MFLWKLINHCLPFPENLKRFNLHLPSMCPFCKHNIISGFHTFFDCPWSKTIWTHFSSILDIPPMQASGVLSSLFHWWFRSNDKTLKQKLIGIIPGFICWNIWKTFNSYIHEGEIPVSAKTIQRISFDIYLWSSSLEGGKLAQNDDCLITLGLAPIFMKSLKVNAIYISWTFPNNSICLHVDSSIINGKAAGGAILRNGKGLFLAGLTIELNSTDIFSAELETVVKASQWAMNKFSAPLFVHTDCKTIENALKSDKTCISPLLKTLKEISNGKDFTLKYVQRDFNQAAHHLARFAIFYSHFRGFWHFCCLPRMVRGCIKLDVSLPHIIIK